MREMDKMKTAIYAMIMQIIMHIADSHKDQSVKEGLWRSLGAGLVEAWPVSLGVSIYRNMAKPKGERQRLVDSINEASIPLFLVVAGLVTCSMLLFLGRREWGG